MHTQNQMIAGEPCFQRRSVPASGGAADRKRGGTIEVAKSRRKEDVYTEDLLAATDIIGWHSIIG